MGKCSIRPLGDVQVVDQLAEGSMVTVFPIAVAWGTKAKGEVGLGDGWHHLIRPTFKNEGAGEVIRGGCDGGGPGRFVSW